MSTEAASRILSGGCQCGAVRYAVSAQPDASTICYCRMCQRAGGGPFMAFARVADASFAITVGEPAVYRSSDIAERGFCRACGTPLFWRMIGGDRISFTWCTLDDATAVSPRSQLGLESRLAWVDELHSLPGERTEQWLDAAKIESVGNRQHLGTDT